jgi:hypothetical protein
MRRIVEPVAPTAMPTAPPSICPKYPPWSRPSAIIRPAKAIAIPLRNGRTSTRALRTTIRPPTPTSAIGSR